MNDPTPVRLADARAGDTVIMETRGALGGPSRYGRRTVARATAKGLCVSGWWYDRDGRCRRSDNLRLADPTPATVAYLRRADEARHAREQAQADEAARRARPEYVAASRLLALDEDELVARLGAARLLEIGRWLNGGG